ncbi:extracellular solute-binding protein [Streptomyces sp. ODS28]|uniref:extracellular solute-binding protein n=1 Tax=Streptomyces sp. ODS28 TaxID=3136688 RepID=UPI0031E5DEE7
MPLSRRRVLTAGAASALAAGTATGCGAARGAAPGPAGPEPVPRGPTTLHWWSFHMAAKNGGDLRTHLISAFERRHPNITVVSTDLPANTDIIRTTLSTTVASGSPRPDVYMGDITWPAQFAHNELALPVGPAVPEGHWQRYPGPLTKALSARGTVYAFPLYLDEAFLYYRKDLLHKHGLRVPRSWEEVARTARRIQRAGDAEQGLLLQGAVAEGLTANTAEYVADAGGSILDPSGTRPTFDSRANERALGYLSELTGSGVLPRAATTFKEQDTMDAFTAGQAVFLRNWSYSWEVIQDPAASKVAGRAGAMRRPGFEGGATEGNSCLGGWCNYINPHSQERGAAIAFARFCAEEEGQQVLLRHSSYVPALLDALESRAARRSPNPTIALSRKVRLVPRPSQTPQYPQVSKAVYTEVNSLLNGASSPRGALSAAQENLRAALEGNAL